MKSFPLYLLLAFALFAFSSCEDDDDGPGNATFGTFEVEFENVMGPQDNQSSFSLAAVGATEYPYVNGMGHNYNLTFLRYYISEVVLEGPNGERFEDPMSVTAIDAKGYYLIDAADASSRIFDLKDVPAGQYNKISFLLGVDSTGVLEGAAGGSLDPATSGMFWNWNSGYVALKVEGQSPASPGGASGNSIVSDNEAGIVFHLGGWKNIANTPFVYNNQRVELDFDTNARVAADLSPTAHLELDVKALFEGPEATVNFATDNVNIHRPTDGAAMAKNAAAAFRYDHIHQ
ncbi:MbnP family protein [Neolewinella persica]|uniref:MbnP family protein n=1 Tax=Neolewinella persica TaxID=70998 RepID=UPI0003612AA0|nr:MbnP family protein [Neolewinella persica]